MLVRARQLEQYLQTPARIYYKNEGVSPPGSHKANTALPQAYYNKIEGIKRLTTETGAGQWGSALAFACQKFGMELMVYMVRCSFEAKPFRRTLIRLWGGNVVASPSDLTEAANDSRDIRYGSLHRDLRGRKMRSIARIRITLGSVLNHVMSSDRYRPELKEQLKHQRKPDYCRLRAVEVTSREVFPSCRQAQRAKYDS